MRAIQKIQKFIELSPESVDAQALAHLILSLQEEADLSSSDLYKLNAEHFDLAMELLRDWRIDRFYKGRARAFNLGQSRPVKRCVPREPLNLGKLGQSIENNPCCQDKDE